MPLIRMELRSEFGMGEPELYRAAGRDDPKALLDGVAVSGLVGILRQLGNLTEFASEIFQDLHDQMTLTASRSGKMLTRIKNIETVLPPIEKMVAGQSGHAHFAYTTGSDWHPKIKIEQNYLSHIDMPRFMLDSYEECREPPRLSLLDRFDPAGSGACLRRYSDPSYFKTVWANSSELLNVEQFQKEMKVLKRKKKLLRHRSGSVSRVSSMSRRYSSGRIQFPVVETDRNSCTTMRRSKSELTKQKVSIDSKVWSGKCDSSITSAGGCEKKGQSELSASISFCGNNALFQHEQPEAIGNPDLPPEPQEDLDSLRSSSVSCSEKKEIVEPPTCKSDYALVDQGLISELVPTTISLSKIVESVARFENEEQSDVIFDVTRVAESTAAVDHNNEVMSETDNYMDALNTMDSESETETECQTKREVDLTFDIKQRREIESSYTTEIATREASSCMFVSSFSLPYSPSRKIPPSASSSGRVQSKIHMELPRSASDSWEGCPETVNEQSCNAFYATGIKPFLAIHGNLSSGSDVPDKQDNTMTDPDYSKGSPKHSNIPPITIWTNGGLLGLQPSKPPDMSVQIDSKNDHVNLDVSFSDEKLQQGEESTPNFTSYISKELGGLDQKENVEEKIDLSFIRSRHSMDGHKANAPVFKFNGHEALIAENSSIFSSQSKPHSPESEKGPRDYASRTSDIVPQESFHFGSSSPPLEHMKISFHPISTSDTSRLKLEFPNKHQFRAIGQDVIFPSFKLLHESPLTPSQDIASESDDDTFCKSSSYMSEDPLSPHSESNSEQWSSGEINETDQPEMYDALCRVQSNASSCSSLDFESVTGKSTLQAQDCVSSNEGISLEKIDEMSSATRHHNAESSSHLNECAPLVIFYPNEMPPPPPLPPLQWRIAKPHLLDVEDESKNFVDITNQAVDKKMEAAPAQKQLIPEIPKLTTPLKDTPIISSKMMIDQHQKLLKVNSELNGKAFGEREDLLHQIRTRSFNLRPTATSKPSSETSAVTNVNVAAILEKANAIRQVVASEEDTWSDS